MLYLLLKYGIDEIWTLTIYYVRYIISYTTFCIKLYVTYSYRSLPPILYKLGAIWINNEFCISVANLYEIWTDHYYDRLDYLTYKRNQYYHIIWHYGLSQAYKCIRWFTNQDIITRDAIPCFGVELNHKTLNVDDYFTYNSCSTNCNTTHEYQVFFLIYIFSRKYIYTIDVIAI
jgi:hypothetical protein